MLQHMVKGGDVRVRVRVRAKIVELEVRIAPILGH